MYFSLLSKTFESSSLLDFGPGLYSNTCGLSTACIGYLSVIKVSVLYALALFDYALGNGNACDPFKPGAKSVTLEPFSPTSIIFTAAFASCCVQLAWSAPHFIDIRVAFCLDSRALIVSNISGE